MRHEVAPIHYISYNGLGRSPMVWGIPYMTGLVIMAVSMLGGLVLGTYVGSWGWALVVLGIPVGMFVKMLCVNDDQAVRILLLEVKWVLIRHLSARPSAHRAILTIAPTRYGRRLDDAQRYFEKSICR